MPGVADAEPEHVARVDGKLYAGAVRAELHGIGEEVKHDLLHASALSPHWRQVRVESRKPNVDPARTAKRHQETDDILNGGPRIKGRRMAAAFRIVIGEAG
jgi:hypothetical protein